MRSIAFASLLLLFGLAVVVMNMRSRGNESAPVAKAPASSASDQVEQIKTGQAEPIPSASTDVATAPLKHAVPAEVPERSRAGNLIKRGR